jgi:hypothetical protein
MTFTATGKAALSDWIAANALVCWVESPTPWEVEHQLIETLSLPLNLQGNERHQFHPTLSKQRKLARQGAAGLPIVPK